MGTPTLDWRMKGSKGVRISRFQEMVHHSAGMYYARESSEEDLTSWLIWFFFFPLTKVLLRLTSFWRLKAVSFWCLQHGRPAPPRRICTQGASCFCDLSSSFCKAFLGGLSVLVMRVDVELGVTSCWRLSDGGSGRAHARVRAHIHMGPRGGSPLT